ncbi:hypothetical protein ACSBR2_022772 [Camellia fascicularis]
MITDLKFADRCMHVIWRSQTFDLKFLVLGSLSLVHSLASSAHISFGFTLRWLLFAKYHCEVGHLI